MAPLPAQLPALPSATCVSSRLRSRSRSTARRQCAMRKRVALVTAATDEYSRGATLLALRLHAALSDHADVLVYGSVEEHMLTPRAPSGKSGCGVIVRPLQDLQAPAEAVKLLEPAFSHFRFCWRKLALWALDEYDLVVYMDADMLLLNDRCLRRIVCDPSRWPQRGRIAAVPACQCWKGPAEEHLCVYTRCVSAMPGQFYFNAGLMIFRPDCTELKGMSEAIRQAVEAGREFPFAEQDFLNEHFTGRCAPLPAALNVLKPAFMYPRHREALLPIEEKVDVIHYVMTKPWNVRAANLEPEFGWLHGMWLDAWAAAVGNVSGVAGFAGTLGTVASGVVGDVDVSSSNVLVETKPSCATASVLTSSCFCPSRSNLTKGNLELYRVHPLLDVYYVPDFVSSAIETSLITAVHATSGCSPQLAKHEVTASQSLVGVGSANASACVSGCVSGSTSANFGSSQREGPGRWHQLRRRRVQCWGGVPHPNGAMCDPLPGHIATVASAVAGLSVGRRDSIGNQNPEMPSGAQAVAVEADARGGSTATCWQAADQCIVNVYAAGDGIDAHFDGPAFDPEVAILSLEGSALIRFSLVEKQLRPDLPRRLELLLRPRSLLLFSGEAYELYVHAVPHELQDVLSEDCANLDAARAGVGEAVPRSQRRTSLTLRRLKHVSARRPEGGDWEPEREADVAGQWSWWAKQLNEID
eukprot:TRINITY_DN34304_c0_g1_i1.p1 TRINITY_DN34304_c0_g1~~TRINITY_DN34304_c0_g1_i1.p1  ORF type:complete len:698 (+),score=97.79 TRINITY_DN34304_c0_g1_i1:103-2196(+)